MGTLSDISMVALGAGSILRNTHTLEIGTKGEADFVTQADTDVQQYIITCLSRLYPNASFIAEENPVDNIGFSLMESDNKSREAFIIDPIDGTTNLINHIPICAICIAYYKDGLIRDSVVYNPFMNEMYSASLGKGAWLNRRRIISDIPESALSKSIMIIEDQFGNEPISRFKIKGNLAGYRSLGSAALSICYVACNRASAYVSCPLHIWDYAAASLILDEAGGKLLDLNELLEDKESKPCELGITDSLMACTKSLHSKLGSIIL